MSTSVSFDTSVRTGFRVRRRVSKDCGVWTKPLARRTLRVSLARSPG
jgi:hypothetical protein